MEVHVEALPLEVPQQFELDVSELHIGESVRIGDLSIPEGVTVLDDAETVVATVTVPTRVEEPEVEAVEGEEPAEAAAGEAEGAEAETAEGGGTSEPEE
jgi:large subunit ribosomal protein L25